MIEFRTVRTVLGLSLDPVPWLDASTRCLKPNWCNDMKTRSIQPNPSLRYSLALCLLALWLSAAVAAGAQVAGQFQTVKRFRLPLVDQNQLQALDESRVKAGQSPHFAHRIPVEVSPWTENGWEVLADGKLRWRLRLHSPRALSLSLGFGRYWMPAGGELTLHTADGKHHIGPFTEHDNEEHRQLWTPPIPGQELVLDLRLPMAGLEKLELRLTSIQHGYAGFGQPTAKSGDCHVDVVCAEADPWIDEVRAVGLVAIGGVRFCTGFLLNNSAQDGRPLFATASHCEIDEINAPSVVVVWNHQRAICERGPKRPLNRAQRLAAERRGLSQFQTGAVLRAEVLTADAVLLELDDLPDPAFGVFYAGWDRSDSVPLRTAAIHHPNTDVKRISFDRDPAPRTDHLSRQPAAGSHLRVDGWEVGSTEGGSSGGPLFNQDHRVVGQLHGGYAACGNQGPDWFGRLATSWAGNDLPGGRFSDWLDPLGSGLVVLDGVDAAALAPISLPEDAVAAQ